MMHGGEVVIGDAAEPFDGVLQFDDGETVWANVMAETFALRPFEERGTGAASAADGAILAPMPGKVIAVDVAEGDAVTAGQRLMVLEAMKMEHALTAPFDWTVTELSASEGGQVQVEVVLCVVEPTGDE
jgi:3-methylcrotonyl-CoA carboxylase alpha subunit